VDTVFLRRLRVLVFIEYDTRRKHLRGVTSSPNGEWTGGSRLGAMFDRSNISEANEIEGSQPRSQRRQILGYARPQLASINAANRHVRPHLAPSADRPNVPSKQRVAGSNPARRTQKPSSEPCSDLEG
jgi:hypothetical protein